MSARGRRRDGEARAGATTLELFYDLVFVFAVTQVSHALLGHLTWTGVGEALLVLLVVWWSWNYTTWFTNELDPDANAVRVALIALMLTSLLMAVAIPQAFGSESLLFAGSYVAIQVGRTAFLAFFAGTPGTVERQRAELILLWFLASGVLWIAGAIVDGPLRTVLWLGGLALDYGGPLVTFRVPGRSRLAPGDWDVGAAHFTERFGLFVIIALGESIVLIGATTSGRALSLATLVGLALAFVGTATLWWLYFNTVAGMIERRLAMTENRTLLARDAFTYLHVVIVAGVIVAAVGQELVIAHPTEELHGAELVAVVAGPALYLLAHGALRLRMTGSVSAKRTAGAVACVAVAALGGVVPALGIEALLVAILLAVVIAEEVAGVRRRARGEPSPRERLEGASRSPGAGASA